MREGKLHLVGLVLKLEVELLGDQCDENLHLGLCEGFAKAAASAAVEGNPAAGVALLAARREAQRIVVIEPLG